MNGVTQINTFLKYEVREPVEPGKLYTLRMRPSSVVLSAERRDGWIHLVYTHELTTAPVNDRAFFFMSSGNIVGAACNPCRFICEVREPTGGLTGLYLFEHVDSR